MATRLYPNTKNTEVICRLLNVPLDTAEKHAAIEAGFKRLKATLNEGFADLTPEQQAERRDEYRRQDELEWDAMHQDPHIAEYDGFKTSGWGRVGPLCVGYSGGETDPVKVAAILQEKWVNLNGVTLEELEGVHWC